ncbi:MAG: substrate-binding periplasmic protein [Desulfovibrionaceae bacterium]
MAYAGEAIRFVEDVRPPFAVSHADGTTGGMAAELTREVFFRLGKPVELGLLPWRRVLRMAQQGDVDGIMLLQHSEDREQYLVYSDPVVSLRASLYYNPTRIEQPRVRDLEDLQSRVIGLVNGYFHGAAFDCFLQTDQCRIVPAYTQEENVRRLVSGRVEMIISTDAAVGDVLERNPDFRSRIRRCCDLGSYDYHMALSRVSPHAALMPRINEVLESMRHEGVIQRIFRLSDQ